MGEAKKEEGTSAGGGSQLPDDKGDNNKGESGARGEPDSRREPDCSKGRLITYRMEGDHRH